MDNRPEVAEFDIQASFEDANTAIPDENDNTSGVTLEDLGIADQWMNTTSLARATDKGTKLIQRLVNSIREEHPDQFDIRVSTERGRPVEHFSPVVVQKIVEEVYRYQPAPDGWVTKKVLAEELGISQSRCKKLVEEIRSELEQDAGDSLPAQTGYYYGSQGKILEHISPDVAKVIHDKLAKNATPAPEGWVTTFEVAKTLGMSPITISNIIDALPDDYQTMHGTYLGANRQPTRQFHPDLIAVVKQQYEEKAEPVQEGWVTAYGLASELNVTRDRIVKIMDELRGQSPDSFRDFRTVGHDKAQFNGPVREHMSPQIATMIADAVRDVKPAPDGWCNTFQLARELEVDHSTVSNLSIELDPESSEVGLFQATRGQIVKHYSPKLSEAIRMIASTRKQLRDEASASKLEQEQLVADIKDFLIDIGEGEGVQAEEFNSLLHLFGAERAIDILYQFRPDYKKLPIPYVKSALSDYLGEYMTLRGEFTLDGFDTKVGLLTEPSFKNGLIEVVKSDCLRLLNEVSRQDLENVNLGVVTEYLGHIRMETITFSTPDLEDVLDEVEAYYQLLFENIHKPDSFIDQIGEGRLFPDINQRINVQEIAFKHRMLIADEMGLGKSASAIMAKEILGVNQALIVVPSNVVEVWQNYLVDYFKEGRAPSVLTVDSLESLQSVDALSYDYVIISQERLNEDYVEAISNLSYGMLIVDEMHKLKNISYGKRAECLVELAKQVNGDDQYLVLLSGTPVPNKISDVALTLKLLYPNEFEGISNKDLVSQIINGDIFDLRSLLVPRMQMKQLAESIEMPKLIETVEKFDLSPQEREIYGILVEEDELTAAEKLKILRQFILNPRLLDSTPDIRSSKVDAVSNALEQTFSSKDKVVMFVNGYIEGVMRGDQTIIDQLDVPEGVDVFTIDGSIPKEYRLAVQEKLKESGRKVLLIVSGQTADVGVDFSAAEEVYFYNEPWTEYDKLQQRGRVFRPGLKQDLIVKTFVAAGTIEDGIHRYIQSKHQAVEKLLRGIPISELEREIVRAAEQQTDQPDLEVNRDLAEYYFSSWDKMMRIYGHVKELGEDDFRKFLANYDVEYAESYANLVGSRSYQANVARLSGTLLDKFTREQGKDLAKVRILDIASGPEMLRRHIPEVLSDKIVSLDINGHHFSKSDGRQTVGSFLSLPIANDSVDYVNLSLGLHYTNFAPSKGAHERLEVLKELNRVLKTGGRGIVDMIYSLEFVTDENFRATMGKLGFQVVEDYTGIAEDNGRFRSQIITLEKIRDCKKDVRELAAEIGPQGVKAIKFKKTKVSLKDSRKIATTVNLGQSALNISMNGLDELVLAEEQEVMNEMDDLKRRYGNIKQIPRDQILSKGLSRVFNGRRYVLFKRLVKGSGAVVVR